MKEAARRQHQAIDTLPSVLFSNFGRFGIFMEEVPLSLLPSSMPESFRMEEQSLIYIRAIASAAKVSIYKPERDIGTDLSFYKVLERNGHFTDMVGYPLPCQAKAT